MCDVNMCVYTHIYIYIYYAYAEVKTPAGGLAVLQLADSP